MKKILAVTVLIVGLATVAGSKPDPIEVQLFGDSKSSLAAVTLHDTSGADSMIVSVFYWTKYPGINQEILLNKVSVQPAYQDVAMASDSIAVPKEQIRSVSVTLVKNLSSKKFEYGTAIAQHLPPPPPPHPRVM